MRAGKLDKRISLQKLQSTRDAHGGESGEWVTVVERWADITPLAEREILETSAAQNEATVRIRIRHYAEVKNDWKVLHKTDSYKVVSVIHTNADKRQTVLMCRRMS